MVDVATPRFPRARADHYESFYLRAWDPAGPRALWIRYTTSRAARETHAGALWVTASEPSAVTTFRQDGLPATPGAAGRWIDLGRASIVEDLDRALVLRGSAEAGGHTASWDLMLRSPGAPWLHLAPAWLYGAPIPRTKSTSPVVCAPLTGSVSIDGDSRHYPLGMIGHNWGSEHAHRWIWIHGANASGDAVDLVGGQLKIAGRVLPWRISGLVSLAGSRRRVGGMAARATVSADPDRCTFSVSGVHGRITAGPRAHLTYEDPAGGRAHEVFNSSISSLEVSVGDRRLALEAAAYELGVPADGPTDESI